MKKTLLFLLSFVLATSAFAQTATVTLTTPPCNNDGVLAVNVIGVTPPMTVTWYTYGVAGTTITHAGVTGTSDVLTSYSGGPVYVSATNGTATAVKYFPGAPPFTYTITPTPAVCPAPGTATVAITGGTSPFTYSWFNKVTMAVVSTTNLGSLPSGGKYGVTITDNAGCKYGSMARRDSFDTNLPAFSVSVPTTTANCTNGTATASVSSGATGALSYLWSTGATTPSIASLVMGSYAVDVTDAAGCTATGYGYVNQAIFISVPITATPATCTNTDGAVIAFGSGGIPPYTYLWSNGATTASQTGIASGSYGVTAIDVNGCRGMGSTTVSVSTPITATFSTTPSSCTAPTGSATLTLAGGTAPYTYLWYTSPVQTTATATSLAPGAYSFKVTDAVGCTQTGTVTVPPVNIINGIFSAVSPLCATPTGSLSIAPSGGVTPYTYLWNTGATTAGISSITAGYYSVTITDNMGCKATLNHALFANSPLGIGISTTPASCILTPDASITATPIGGTPPYTYVWNTGATTATASGLMAVYSDLTQAPYFVTVTDNMGCVAKREYIYTGYNPTNTSCYCTIQGNVYHDINGNCTKDAGEPGVQNIQIHISTRGYTYTDAAGNYSMKVPSGSYTVTQTVQAFYPLSPCQTNNIPVTATATTGCTIPVNFANAINPIHSMYMRTWACQKPVPGNPYLQLTIIKNEGTVTENSVLSGYKTDGQLLAPTFVPSGVFTGGSNYYNTAGGFPTMAPGAEQVFLMKYNVPTNIPIGTSVLFKDSTAYTAPMSNWLADYSPWNNVNYFVTPVVGPYDPNFKEVYPIGSGPTGIITYDDSLLDYMVHFQNLGNWYAQNVVVLDTLDEDLDWTTLHPVYMSAPCQVTLTESGPYKIAKFEFVNINLTPKSMDDLRSQGMFTYTIKTKSGLALGTQFKNSASIYFDYNEPVKTNTTLNTIGLPSGVPSTFANDHRSFVVYPNPAGQTFNAVINSENETEAVMQLADVTGKVHIIKNLNLRIGTQSVAADISQLAPGIYFVTLNANGKVSTAKLVVMK